MLFRSTIFQDFLHTYFYLLLVHILVFYCLFVYGCPGSKLPDLPSSPQLVGSSSLSRDGPWAPCIGSAETSSGPPGESPRYFFFWPVTSFSSIMLNRTLVLLTDISFLISVGNFNISLLRIIFVTSCEFFFNLTFVKYPFYQVKEVLFHP